VCKPYNVTPRVEGMTDISLTISTALGTELNKSNNKRGTDEGGEDVIETFHVFPIFISTR